MERMIRSGMIILTTGIILAGILWVSLAVSNYGMNTVFTAPGTGYEISLWTTILALLLAMTGLALFAAGILKNKSIRLRRRVIAVTIAVVLGAASISVIESVYYPFSPSVVSAGFVSNVMGAKYTENFLLFGNERSSYFSWNFYQLSDGYRMTGVSYFEVNGSNSMSMFVYQCNSDGNAAYQFHYSYYEELGRSVAGVSNPPTFSNATSEGNIQLNYSVWGGTFTSLTGYYGTTCINIQTQGGPSLLQEEQLISIFNEEAMIINTSSPYF